ERHSPVMRAGVLDSRHNHLDVIKSKLNLAYHNYITSIVVTLTKQSRRLASSYELANSSLSSGRRKRIDHMLPSVLKQNMLKMMFPSSPHRAARPPTILSRTTLF